MQILKLIESTQGSSFYELNDRLKPLVSELVQEPASQPLGTQSLSLGQGEWTVFFAPHIVAGASAVGAKFDPILYRLDGNKIVSNVRYQLPLLGSGWLSAAGTPLSAATIARDPCAMFFNCRLQAPQRFEADRDAEGSTPDE